jgi:magnesium-transporting ATPase (P-type)
MTTELAIGNNEKKNTARPTLVTRFIAIFSLTFMSIKTCNDLIQRSFVWIEKHTSRCKSFHSALGKKDYGNMATTLSSAEKNRFPKRDVRRILCAETLIMIVFTYIHVAAMIAISLRRASQHALMLHLPKTPDHTGEDSLIQVLG